MKKKRKIILGYWYYTIVGGVFALILPWGPIVIMVMQMAYISLLPALYYFLLWIAVCGLLWGLIGYYAIQFTILTEDGIKVRCLWRTIRKLKWKEIKEVRLEKFWVSVQGGFSSKWYVFDDGVERPFTNGIAHKNTHITLPSSERTKKIVGEFWTGGIIEKVIEDDG